METAKGYIIVLDHDPQPYEDFSYDAASFLNLIDVKSYIMGYKIEALKDYYNDKIEMSQDKDYKEYTNEEIEEKTCRDNLKYTLTIRDVSTLEDLIDIDITDSLDSIREQLNGI